MAVVSLPQNQHCRVMSISWNRPCRAAYMRTMPVTVRPRAGTRPTRAGRPPGAAGRATSGSPVRRRLLAYSVGGRRGAPPRTGRRRTTRWAAEGEGISRGGWTVPRQEPLAAMPRHAPGSAHGLNLITSPSSGLGGQGSQAPPAAGVAHGRCLDELLEQGGIRAYVGRSRPADGVDDGFRPLGAVRGPGGHPGRQSGCSSSCSTAEAAISPHSVTHPGDRVPRLADVPRSEHSFGGGSSRARGQRMDCTRASRRVERYAVRKSWS
ncbi:hypothetical protein SANTM175S_07581 [Streptomyces antimycoticus]